MSSFSRYRIRRQGRCHSAGLPASRSSDSAGYRITKGACGTKEKRDTSFPRQAPTPSSDRLEKGRVPFFQTAEFGRVARANLASNRAGVASEIRYAGQHAAGATEMGERVGGLARIDERLPRAAVVKATDFLGGTGRDEGLDGTEGGEPLPF